MTRRGERSFRRSRVRSRAASSRRRQVLLAVLVMFASGSALWARSLSAEERPAPQIRGARLYLNPDSPARRQADSWQRSRKQDAALMRKIAEQPTAVWLGEWSRDVRRDVDAIVSRASGSRSLPVFVAYNIPNRDCGLHSRGGAGGANDYRRWIVELARGLRGRPSIIILEPDGIPGIDCLPARLRDERYVLIREAVEVLTKAGASVYVDAGNAAWQQPGEMANRLQSANIGRARGFALNVSNFHSTSANVDYGNRVSRLIGGKHYVIDTSRNGRGARVEREWCNARNQALGRAPTTDTGIPLVDALLWVKTPGESDGSCNGGPNAGKWWPEYALELSRTAQQLGSVSAR